ncbi:transposase [Gemmata sp. JC673]|uniref:Transposase n=1 Tax=Gemmata algarum TaxID=2975278 RepID=A0ABU5F4M0_9BACT|nr:transposase [Gemmata algarum]MDY3561163.1 transposase [Gemmata algarum]
MRAKGCVELGVYSRMLLVGYFEGIGSPRSIVGRSPDSLSLRAFLGIPPDKAMPEHSTLTNTRKRLPEEVFDDVFRFVLGVAGAKMLVAGTTASVDSTLAKYAQTDVLQHTEYGSSVGVYYGHILGPILLNR